MKTANVLLAVFLAIMAAIGSMLLVGAILMFLVGLRVLDEPDYAMEFFLDGSILGVASAVLIAPVCIFLWSLRPPRSGD